MHLVRYCSWVFRGLDCAGGKKLSPVKGVWRRTVPSHRLLAADHPIHVRFAAESCRAVCRLPCPLWARLGLSRAYNRHFDPDCCLISTIDSIADQRFKETDMPISELADARRRAIKIGLIVGMLLLVASFVMRAIDIYQTQQSISSAAIASLALGALAFVMIAAAYFYEVLRKK